MQFNATQCAAEISIVQCSIVYSNVMRYYGRAEWQRKSIYNCLLRRNCVVNEKRRNSRSSAIKKICTYCSNELNATISRPKKWFWMGKNRMWSILNGTVPIFITDVWRQFISELKPYISVLLTIPRSANAWNGINHTVRWTILTKGENTISKCWYENVVDGQLAHIRKKNKNWISLWPKADPNHFSVFGCTPNAQWNNK